jgi:1,4-dihydroxy-2-naphthoate octaprenyltransferase
MDENHVKVNSAKAWLLASRPKTLAGAAVPVLIGTAFALRASGAAFRWTPCVLCFLFALLMQIDANFVNDYFDFKKGNDDADTRLGPLRACSMGWVTPRAMQWALALTTAVSCAVGLPLILFGGWQMILVGVLCVVFCFLYTTTLSYLGLGDVLVLVFFGLVPVSLTYYLCMPEDRQGVSAVVLLASLACGFAIDALLMVNNYRDIDNDRRDGKMTLVVRAGHRGGQLLYLSTGIVAVTLMVIAGALSRSLWVVVLPLAVYLPLHLQAYRRLVSFDRGKALNKVLGMTARNILLFGLSVAAGALL